MDLLDFNSTYIKILFTVNSKHSSFWPSTNAKPMPNDLAHANAHAVHVCSLNVYTMVSMDGIHKSAYENLNDQD